MGPEMTTVYLEMYETNCRVRNDVAYATTQTTRNENKRFSNYIPARVYLFRSEHVGDSRRMVEWRMKRRPSKTEV
jgi:hypothetical protein